MTSRDDPAEQLALKIPHHVEHGVAALRPSRSAFVDHDQEVLRILQGDALTPSPIAPAL